MLYGGQQRDPRWKYFLGGRMVLVRWMGEDLDNLSSRGTWIVVVNDSTCKRRALAYL